MLLDVFKMNSATPPTRLLSSIGTYYLLATGRDIDAAIISPADCLRSPARQLLILRRWASADDRLAAIAFADWATGIFDCAARALAAFFYFATSRPPRNFTARLYYRRSRMPLLPTQGGMS